MYSCHFTTRKGNNMLQWTQPEVIAEATKFPTRSAFRNGNQHAYRLALKWNLLDDIYPESARRTRTSKWTQLDVIFEATKYPTRSAFHKGNQYAYTLALKWNLLDDLYPESSKLVQKAIAKAKWVNHPVVFRRNHPDMAALLHHHGFDNWGQKRQQK